MVFKKFDSKKIESVVDYVRDYIMKNPNTEILIGSDLQNRGYYMNFSTVIAMYEPGHGINID